MRRKQVSVSPANLPSDRADGTEAKRKAAVREARMARSAKASYHPPEFPTPERALRAEEKGEPVQTVEFEEEVEVSEGDRFVRRKVGQVHFRVCDDPFSRLCGKGYLGQGDANRNLVLCQAGLRYREIWMKAGRRSPGSVDWGRLGISTNSGMFESESVANAFAILTRIEISMGAEQRVVARAIVLEDREVLDIGRQISGYAAEKQATACALMLLRQGLSSVARVLGISMQM